MISDLIKKKWLQTILHIGVVLIGGAGFAAFLHIFVFGSGFLPMGIDGISTMVQYLTGFNAGYIGLILNVPLLIAAWFVLKRRYVLYTALFSVTQQLSVVLFAHMRLYQYVAENGDYIMAALIAGVVLGAICGIMQVSGGSTGGIDIIAGLVLRKAEHLRFDRILLATNAVMILLSFAVFGHNLTAVFLSLIFAFAYSMTIEAVMRFPKAALMFNIVTEHADEIKEAVIQELRHGVTVIPATGGLTGEDKSYLVCVVNKRDVGAFRKIIEKYDKTFAFFVEADDVIGNFWRSSRDEIK
ncbi:membrane protein [Spirochaetia bacterium]|nr:membrane protein [Spirochaetia bacterium]